MLQFYYKLKFIECYKIFIIKIHSNKKYNKFVNDVLLIFTMS